MKKVLVSAGIAAIGAASLHADVYAPDITANDASKMWSVSGTLRGFYDDNYTTAHSDATGKRASWGAELSPSLSFIVPLQQTELGLRYTYGLYYYQDRENIGQNPIDQSHEADLWVDHAFTERLEGKIQDAFTVSQEPQLSASPTSLPYRAEGNNIENQATLTVHTEWSLLFSTDVGYENTFVDYQQHGATIATLPVTGATLAGLLNMDGHSFWANLNYQYLPNLTFLVGYQFGLDDFIGNEPISIDTTPAHNVYFSDSRNEFSNYGYIGAQYAFNENLSATAQVGAQISDSYNLPSFDTQSSTFVEPYANLAVTYTYLPGDYAQLGFTQSESPTSIASTGSTAQGVTLFQETSVVYASVNHQITPKLLGSIIGHYQLGGYEGGAAGSAQAWYSLGLNLSYAINPFLSAEVGYNFDYADSGGGVATSYARNREYIGITATY